MTRAPRVVHALGSALVALGALAILAAVAWYATIAVTDPAGGGGWAMLFVMIPLFAGLTLAGVGLAVRWASGRIAPPRLRRLAIVALAFYLGGAVTDAAVAIARDARASGGAFGGGDLLAALGGAFLGGPFWWVVFQTNALAILAALAAAALVWARERRREIRATGGGARGG